MKRISVVGILIMMGIVLSGCSGNKLSGKWVSYSSHSEKSKMVWEIDKEQKKITETDYSNGEKDDVTVVNIEVDDEKELMTVSLGGLTETLPYTLKDDKLTVDDEEFFKEGSKAEEQAKEKAKNSRLESEKEESVEKAKEAKLAKKEKAYNKTVEALEKRLNEEFKKNYQGNWYLGEGIDTESYFPSTSVTKLTFADDKISEQSSQVKAPKDDPREVKKGDVTHYTFSGIRLPKKSDYTEDDSDYVSYNEYELPETEKEIEAIKTLQDFANYEKEHNVRKIVFVYQSNGGSMSDSEMVLNVNDLSNIIPGSSFSDDTYKKELPSGIQENDFDI
ncbi:hypothetical protein [Enterococcus sp. DIV0187]|uniref:hypothetical protein n=1 Tax=Enterococcus sp. DIV0187 TaxID=2774644 RepID=UPI003F271C1B